MFDYIKGQLTKISTTSIVIEAYGIGYIIHVANPYRYSGELNSQKQLYLHQVVREDAHLLYGFASEDEKAIFLNLISVSGIGPTTALAIIAVDDNEGLTKAIVEKDITYLTKFPKIGKKTAQQMILDLESKISASEPQKVSSLEDREEMNLALEEAFEALLALGYKATELKKIRSFFEGTSETTENYIKSSLKLLMK